MANRTKQQQLSIRLSDKDYITIARKIRASGLTKQEYITKALLEWQYNVASHIEK